MNTTEILLIVVLFFAVFAIIVLSVKISVLTGKNVLYQEFTKRTPVKKFLAVLDKTYSGAIDPEISSMLQKYFELVLMKLSHEHVPNLLKDLDQSKYSGILIKSLSRATAKDDGIFGLALAKNIDNPKNKLAIEFFLTNLPEEQKKKQYQVALNVVEENYRMFWDYPSEYKKPFEDVMEEFRKKIA